MLPKRPFAPELNPDQTISDRYSGLLHFQAYLNFESIYCENNCQVLCSAAAANRNIYHREYDQRIAPVLQASIVASARYAAQ